MEAVRAERSFYTADEVMELLGCKKDKAYKVIASLKRELIKSGRLTPDYPAGKVPKAYFNERCCIG